MKKYILYVRCSTQQQDVDMQRRDLVKYAESRKWQYQVAEEKISGSTGESERSILSEVMKKARKRQIDGIAVWRLDRLFRSLKHAVITLNELMELGVDFYSHMDHVDLMTSQGRLQANLLMAFAEFHRELIVSNVRKGLDAAKARGVSLGRPKKINQEVIYRVHSLRKNETSIREISRLLGISKSSVERALKYSALQKPTSSNAENLVFKNPCNKRSKY